MKVYAIDLLNNDRRWKKKWETLDINDVYKCKNDICQSSVGKTLFVLHGGCGPASITSVCKSVNSGSEKYVLVVSGGGRVTLPDDCKSNPRIHSTINVFPNSPQSIAHLRPRFERLCTALETASTDDEVRAAWKEFDKEALSKLIEILSPLTILGDDKGGAEAVVNRIRQEFDDNRLRLAAGQLAEENQGELELAGILVSSLNETAISAWAKKHSSTLGNLARRFL